jgi:glycosyltransferase involved in cell wall biosynthesis
MFFALRGLGGALGAMKGMEVEVHGVSDGLEGDDAPSWGALKCVAHPRVGPGGLAYAPRLGGALLAGGYDLLHTHGIWQWPSAAVSRWHGKTGRPYVVSPHGMLDPWAVSRSRWKKRLVSVCYERAHLREAGCLHALCEAEAEAIRAYGLRQPIAVIPNGVDLPEGEVGVRGEDRWMLFMGRLHPKKGMLNALRAWAGRREEARRGGWRLVVAGWDQGGHEGELKRLATERGLTWAEVPAGELVRGGVPGEAEVIFAGPAFGEVKDALMRRVSAFVLPSFSEGLPMSVLEAWAYRLPVLMTDHCNLPEGFAAGAAVRTGTGVEEIAVGLGEFFGATGGWLEGVGAKGRALVEGSFTWVTCAAQMAEVYRWQLGAGAKPSFVRG